ncbi:hypothetical protein K1W69_07190 [Hoeflea sp. WL0058]|uniref:Uncharacterized protein n=1 Tax=Flavimaribacter sediminis TaxID=2865987 RepID=A0AAE3D0U2_9HYPH|nr:hypothetical protein [Flavimaribacter sediminis]MBW8636968.1 hypothetical protein [Flavimaribacter sediminis]
MTTHVDPQTFDLVESWLSAHGGPRRFPAGTSSDYFGVQRFLEERGYTLTQVASKFTLSSGKGRPRTLSWRDVIELVDTLRSAEGLPTFRLCHSSL